MQSPLYSGYVSVMGAASINWIYQNMHLKSSSRNGYCWLSMRPVKDLVLVKREQGGLEGRFDIVS